MAFGVKQKSLFWLILANDLKVKHTAAIDTGRYQAGFLLIEIGEVDQANLQGQGFDMVQVLVKDMKFEIARDRQIELLRI